MKVDLMQPAMPLSKVGPLASAVHQSGFSGMVFLEAARTPFLSATAAALAAPLDLASGVAVAFARSPMVTAQLAWELAELSDGRFRLGLGAQVRAHVERRYSAAFDRPGPRLREYVCALKAIFAAFRNEEPLDFKGDFYSFSLLPSAFSPGPITCDRPMVDVAGVNPWMLRMAGEVADGLHVHPLNNAAYLRNTLVPEVAKGAAKAGRDPAELTLFVPCFAAGGETEAEVVAGRETVRRQVSFYGSTPNYAFLFEEAGFEGTTERIRERQKAGDSDGMAAVVTDELLDHFAAIGTFAELPKLLIDRYEGIADRVVLYLTQSQVSTEPENLDRWGAVAREVVLQTSSSRPTR